MLAAEGSEGRRAPLPSLPSSRPSSLRLLFCSAPPAAFAALAVGAATGSNCRLPIRILGSSLRLASNLPIEAVEPRAMSYAASTCVRGPSRLPQPMALHCPDCACCLGRKMV
jgi:hypothetical protein